MDVKQAFAELGLNLHTNQTQAKAAYQILAMQWHPSVNAGPHAVARMKAINVAYALVCHHLDSLQKNAARTTKAESVAGACTAARPQGAWVQRTVRVSLFEAAFGCIKRVSGMEPAACVRCAGSGEYAGTWTLGSKCLQCLGRGLHAQPGDAGTLGKLAHCEACQGTGVFKPTPPPCPACRGTGKAERKTWTADVQIQAGALDGSEVPSHDIQVHAHSHEPPAGFKLTVHIEKHPIFKLEQDRLSVTVPISVLRWSLGGELAVPTLDGSIQVPLPGRPAAFWVKEQGWPQRGNADQRKPLFVVPKMVYPDSLDEEGLRLMQELDARCKLPEVEGWNRSVQAWMESAA